MYTAGLQGRANSATYSIFFFITVPLSTWNILQSPSFSLFLFCIQVLYVMNSNQGIAGCFFLLSISPSLSLFPLTLPPFPWQSSACYCMVWWCVVAHGVELFYNFSFQFSEAWQQTDHNYSPPPLPLPLPLTSPDLSHLVREFPLSQNVPFPVRIWHHWAAVRKWKIHHYYCYYKNIVWHTLFTKVDSTYSIYWHCIQGMYTHAECRSFYFLKGQSHKKGG